MFMFCNKIVKFERPSTAVVLVDLELALKLQEDGLDRKKTICRESDMDSDVHEAGYSRSSGRSNGFYFIPGALSVEEQCKWIKESLMSFPQPPNRTNHNAIYGLFPKKKKKKTSVQL
ncbi:unnamed protein product [Brassica oleracea]